MGECYIGSLPLPLFIASDLRVSPVPATYPHWLPQLPVRLDSSQESSHWRNPHEQLAAILPESPARDIYSFIGRRCFRRSTHKRRIR